jgi:hypothetical protein
MQMSLSSTRGRGSAFRRLETWGRNTVLIPQVSSSFPQQARDTLNAVSWTKQVLLLPAYLCVASSPSGGAATHRDPANSAHQVRGGDDAGRCCLMRSTAEFLQKLFNL